MNDRSIAFAAVALLALAAGCHHGDPSTFISVVNHSGEALTDIEVTFPRGTFGYPRLQDGEVFRHWGPATRHCNVSVQFSDDSGHQFPSKDFDFGARCPAEIQLEVNGQKNVTFRLIEPK
jgi:hypothetical protein